MKKCGHFFPMAVCACNHSIKDAVIMRQKTDDTVKDDKVSEHLDHAEKRVKVWCLMLIEFGFLLCFMFLVLSADFFFK